MRLRGSYQPGVQSRHLRFGTKVPTIWIGLDISTCLSISLCVEFIHVMNYRIIINSSNPLKSGLGTYLMTVSQL